MFIGGLNWETTDRKFFSIGSKNTPDSSTNS